MEAKFNDEDMPLCPDCGKALSYERANGRDTETMGGLSIEYVRCNNGCGVFELIEGQIFPSGDLP